MSEDRILNSRSDGPYSVWFKYGSWYVRVGLSEIDGRVEVVQAEVLTAPGKRPVPLSSSRLRFRWASVFDEAKRHWEDAMSAMSSSQDDYWHKRAAAAQRGVHAAAGGRPASLGADHWQKVAEVYTRAVAKGDRRPTQAVQHAFKGSTPSQAAKWVARTRAMKLLPPAPGKGVGGLRKGRKR